MNFPIAILALMSFLVMLSIVSVVDRSVDNNVLIIRGKLVEAGYPTSIPIIPLIVVWGGPVSSTGSHSGSFVEGSHLDEWLTCYYDASEIELDKSLFRWIKADMRKSTFWLK